MKTQAKPAAKPKSKAELIASLSVATELPRNKVAEVLGMLAITAGRELGKKGPGIFVVPGLVRLKTARKPASKAATRPNPFNPGQMMTVAARPARNVVRASFPKSLKESV